MLPAKPPGEDSVGEGTRAIATPFFSEGSPSGEDGIRRAQQNGPSGIAQLENVAHEVAAKPFGVDGADEDPDAIDFLQIVKEAESQARMYASMANKNAWGQTLRAYHNQHAAGSKYTLPEWRGRSKLFIPKTRAAVRKDNAAVAASLFNNIDAINCVAGNESDPKQRAAAAVMQELVNYRTDRNSGKAALPWFLVAMGARQDAVLTGVCATKQYWKQEYRKTGSETIDGEDKETGLPIKIERDVYKLEIDRPDMQLIPPENYVIDATADWTNPAQSAAFLIIKWPMQIEEIQNKQNAPVNPWKPISEAVLKGCVEAGRQETAAIRQDRERGHDRLSEGTTGTTFQIIWVYETYVRVDGDDYCFFSVGDKYYLTDPKPVREVYPEQYGERPVTIGYGNLEAHRIYPMAPAESWQPLQIEANEVRNLMLDATKQNVMPISKVRRGRQVDLEQVRRRSSGSSILVQEPDDVTWESPPPLPQGAILMQRELSIEFDDLAGQQNYGNVEQSNALGKTLGGLKLAAGAANAVQEYDIRIWIETWAAPALSQLVRLEQYYESNAKVLQLCGTRAKIFEKHGVNQITDEMMEYEIIVRVSVGLGAGDPQQRLAKFQSAAAIAAPLLMQSPEFQSGKMELNTEAVIEEIFGAAGYKDGGARFFKDNGQARPNPMADLKTEEIKAKIEKDKKTGDAAKMTGLAALAKAALGKRELEANVVDMMLTHQLEAQRTGADHGYRQGDLHLKATDHGHRHGMALAQYRAEAAAVGIPQNKADAVFKASEAAGVAPPPLTPDAGMASAESEAAMPTGEGAGMEGAADASMLGAPSGTASPESSPASSPPPAPPSGNALLELLQKGEIEFTRGPDGGIKGIRLIPKQSGVPLPPPR